MLPMRVFVPEVKVTGVGAKWLPERSPETASFQSVAALALAAQRLNERMKRMRCMEGIRGAFSLAYDMRAHKPLNGHAHGVTRECFKQETPWVTVFF